jgi:2-aminoethylphosphonate-pyruvate transaminase
MIQESANHHDKLLFTPGPLTTSRLVKEAAVKDLGSRDKEFMNLVLEIRQRLLGLARVSAPEFEAIIMQGSGTFGIEATVSSALPPGGTLLNIVNGAYGRRISQIARTHYIPLQELVYQEDRIPDLAEIEKTLENNPGITHISVIHGETTTGLLNPVKEIGILAARFGKEYIIDAMSTFGAYETDLKELNASFLISSSNKCIEGIPGVSFVLARGSALAMCKGQARTLSLDLYDQWSGLNATGQFRFTPPVQVLLSFRAALDELEREGGILVRGGRYSANNRILIDGMQQMGFELYLPESYRSFIISSFLYPALPGFSFETFYAKLNERGFVIYPGKLSKVDCFRIGNIGQLYPEDIYRLLFAIQDVLTEMDIVLIINM